MTCNRMKLLRISKSHRAGKKLVAVFDMGDGKTKETHFGAIKPNGTPYEDYTTHHDTERRARYRKRHEKDLKTNDPTRAGHLAYWILWGDSTNIAQNVSAYKKRFNL